MRFWLLVFALLVWPLDAAAVYYGQTHDEVLKELGKPASVLKRGEREILLYKQGRIELDGGKVAIVQGITVTDGPVAPSVAPAATVPAELEKPQAEPMPEPKPSSSAAADVPEEIAAANAVPKEMDLLKQVAGSPEKTTAEAAGDRWLKFAFEVLLKGLMMLAALKLTTKYWGIDISWRGLALAAAADAIVRAIVGGLALWALGFGSTMYADEAVGALALLFVLRKVSYNQSLPQAVTVMLTSKTFLVVVGSFLSVFLTRLIFGGSGGLMPF